MRVFIDCDDTLILWGENPNGPMWRSDEYTVNQELIDCINAYLLTIAPPTTFVVVWSGGGKEYAQHWADKYFPDYDAVLSKDITLPKEEDICIDDQVLKVKAKLYKPQEFIEFIDKELESDRQV